MLDSALIKAENDGYSKGSGKSPGLNQFAEGKAKAPGTV